MNSITSMNDLSRGTAEKTLIVESDTEYVPCGFGLKVVNGYVYPITELAKGTSFMSGQGEPLSPEYQAWLGTWTVTSTSAEVTNAPVTFDVTFSKKVANSTYSVAGWGSSVYRLQYPVTADFNAADGSFTMKTIRNWLPVHCISWRNVSSRTVPPPCLRVRPSFLCRASWVPTNRVHPFSATAEHSLTVKIRSRYNGLVHL